MNDPTLIRGLRAAANCAPASVHGVCATALTITALTAAGLCLTGCATGSAPRQGQPAATTVTTSASPSLGDARAGAIQITGAYIPQPASRDVAVAYFTLRDTGPRGDVLLSATTDPASQATVMQETNAGANAGTMTQLRGGLAIPPHGSVALAPGGYHLMLTNPAAPLVAGDHVTITLLLRDAGPVRVLVPVTSLTSDAQNTAMPTMPGM